MHRYAAGSDPVDDLTQPLPHPMRRAGTGFLDVDGPGFVQAVGKVDLYPRQLGGLALRHESEPVAPGHQAAVSIDVAPLIGDEVTAILVVVVLGRGQTTVVWKHVRLQAHLGLADADDLLRKHLGGRILPAEGIECRNRTTIDGERNPGMSLDLTREKPVEDK